MLSKRTLLFFWTSVAVSVFLLGGGFATIRRLLGGGTVGDYVVFSLTLVGLTASLLVAGRVILVLGRAQRRTRRG